MPEQHLTFKDMCAKFEVTPRTLRYYEYIELLSPLKEGRSRFYGSTEIARLTLILRGRRFGFSLEDIRQWLQIYDDEGTDPQLRDWVDRATQQLALLEQQREELEKTIKELRDLRDTSSQSLG